MVSTHAPASRGRVFVIAGPSGVGKGTLVRGVCSRLPGVFVSVSATTRAPRTGEIDGVDYHFVSDADFDALIATGGLVEWATYAGTRYGTPRAPVVEALAAGRTVILEIEVEGARQVRRALPEAVLVFISPPSFEELRARLVARGTESPERVDARLAVARKEMAARREFDHVVVNDQVDRAIADLVELIGPSQPVTPGRASDPIGATDDSAKVTHTS